ncbi:RNA-binding protein [Fusarium mundagurra]|uniref:RNA-binding protein n=1 Tax=Fusarium mundagurra TaxID=1567541 RepID=A0A8H5YLZ5_9HYPO|nr:RNA-binding protein [Fusarium mundagurra]
MVWGPPGNENASFKDKLALKFKTLIERGFRKKKGSKKGSEAIQPLQDPIDNHRTHFSQSLRQSHRRVAIQAFLSSQSTQSQPFEQCAAAPQVLQRPPHHTSIQLTPDSSFQQTIIGVKALPQSRNMIFYDLPVSSTTCSAEEFQNRFQYVTNELRKVVAEHNELLQHAANTPGAASNSSSDTLCGSLVQYEGRMATIGLTFIVDGISHMMTVDHLFNNSLGDENSLFTSDDEPIHRSSSKGEPTSVHQDTSVIPPNPHPDQEKQNFDFGHSSTHESAEEESLNAWYMTDRPRSPLAECLVGQPVPFPHTLDPPAPYLDWAFVDLNSSSANLQLPNIITVDSMSSPVLLRQVSKQPLSHTTSVYMISGLNGTRKGCLFSGLSELGPLQDRSPCRAWKMILDSDQGLEPGECGSIVVDQTTFDIYGHVIGSNIIGDVFVVPLSDTIEQIRVAFNATTVTLPSQNLLLPLRNISEDTMTTQARLSLNQLRSDAAQTRIHSGSAKCALGSFPLAQIWKRPEDPRSHSGQFRRFQTPFRPDEEDTSLLQTLNNGGAGVLDDEVEVPNLLFCHPYTRFAERSIERIQDFCCGASFALDKFVSPPLSSGAYAGSDTRVVDSSIEIPYFAVVTDVGYNDSRTMFKTEEPFRTRLSLSFLTESHSGTLSCQDSQTSLYESVISFGIAVHSIDYWDVYCFEDGDTSISIFGFDFEDDESGSESDFQTPEEMLRHSPRTFFLHTMTLSLDRVLDQHTMILEVFQDFIKRQARYLSKSAKQRNEFVDNSRRLKEALRQVLNSITVLARNVQEFLSNDPRKDLEDVANGGDFADGTMSPSS